MKIVAVIVVRNPKVFEWLGHMPIANWSFTQLEEVRGIDKIVCVADKKLHARAKKLVGAEGIEVAEIPPALKTEPDLHRWLCSVQGPASDADAILSVVPSVPFLHAAKLEACVEEVRDGAGVCYPARPCRVIFSEGHRTREASLPEILPGVKAFRVSTIREPGSFRTVEVGMIEALDITDPDNFAMAQALVSSGTV